MKVVCQHPRFRPQVVTHRRYSSLPRCGDQMLSWHDPSHTTPLVCHERSFPRKPSNFPQPQPDSRHPTMLMRRAAARAEAAEPMGAVRDRHQPHTVAVQTAPHTHSKRARGEAAMTPWAGLEQGVSFGQLKHLLVGRVYKVWWFGTP